MATHNDNTSTLVATITTMMIIIEQIQQQQYQHPAPGTSNKKILQTQKFILGKINKFTFWVANKHDTHTKCSSLVPSQPNPTRPVPSRTIAGYSHIQCTLHILSSFLCVFEVFCHFICVVVFFTFHAFTFSLASFVFRFFVLICVHYAEISKWNQKKRVYALN